MFNGDRDGKQSRNKNKVKRNRSVHGRWGRLAQMNTEQRTETETPGASTNSL